MRLLLIRHAKSDWADPGLPDHDRPLNPRGARDAPAMGAWIADRGLSPALVLCSTSIRTRLTLGLMQPLWPEAPRVTYLRDLFDVDDPEGVLAILREHGEGAESLAMVGHSPGIGALAGMLAHEAPDHPRWDDFPTCAVAAISFEGPMEPGQGTVTAYAVPSDLGLGKDS